MKKSRIKKRRESSRWTKFWDFKPRTPAGGSLLHAFTRFPVPFLFYHPLFSFYECMCIHVYISWNIQIYIHKIYRYRCSCYTLRGEELGWRESENENVTRTKGGNSEVEYPRDSNYTYSIRTNCTSFSRSPYTHMLFLSQRSSFFSLFSISFTFSLPIFRGFSSVFFSPSIFFSLFLISSFFPQSHMYMLFPIAPLCVQNKHSSLLPEATRGQPAGAILLYIYAVKTLGNCL